MVDIKKEIEDWLTSGTDTKEDVLDLVWTIKEEDNLIIAEHPKIPFVLYIRIGDRFVRLIVSTGMDTALLDPQQRLDIYRKLLILNDRIDLVKFVISGVDEEIILKVDLDKSTLVKDEFRDAITGIVASLYMMVKEFQLEEEFNRRVTERIISMVQEKMNEGATTADLLAFLTKKVGLDNNTAQRIIDEITKKKEYQAEYQ
ncbi:MAG: DNA-binding protein [Aciduliprofundum sp.]|nr:MAG: DNA-binding protein [Aciduliprofundum sp.]